MNAKVVALLVVVAFAAGWYFTPTKVVTKTEIKEVIKEVETTHVDAERDKHKTTTTTEVTKPDGTKETTTTVTEDSSTHKETSQSNTTESTRTEESSKEVTRGSAKVTIAALASKSLGNLTQSPVYGGMVYKEILGPVGVGLGALTDSTVFAMIGMSF